LGVLVLNQVEVKKAQALLGTLVSVAEICLEKLAHLRAERFHELTGLAVEQALYARMEAIEAMIKAPEMQKRDLASLPAYKLCLGLVVFELINEEELSQRHGYQLVEILKAKLAYTLKQNLPADMLAVKLTKGGVALLFQAVGRESCRKLALEKLAALKTVEVLNPLTRAPLRKIITAGFGFYPNDLSGSELQLKMVEQAHLLLTRVIRAAKTAAPWTALGWAERLKKGGRIIEILPQSRYCLNLGRSMGAKVGQTFAIMGPKEVYKGDLRLLQVRKRYSLAEMSYQSQTNLAPSVGDHLELVRNLATNTLEPSLPQEADFYALMEQQSLGLKGFTLVMLQLDEVADKTMEASLLLAREKWQESFKENLAPTLMGLHGANILLGFHPNILAYDLKAPYEELFFTLKAAGLKPVIGLTPYPFLEISRSQVQDYGLKALEYAQLLPEPQVGICNSIALTISADRKYSRGDLFGALEEYKQALLADANNELAWNSMGVCMAAMGRQEEALSHFQEALKHHQGLAKPAEIYYNLGTLWQSLGDAKESLAAFEKCVQLDPKHLYAWIRLGQYWENQGDWQKAKEIYLKGDQLEEEGSYASNLAKRHLAEIYWHEQEGDEARVLLQKALQHNPHDARAMLLLAQIYLEGGEDPSIAEMLARKSLNLQNSQEAWKILALALKSMGEEEKANAAQAKVN
ncbi:MAG: tetratricopeptide repeat protein, partial [Desulfovibrionaceae bacterium]|nr:tetratricopeptide repeat protein [Desulfovibrionaceae bacterium]